jgi:hypothetical protein
VVLGYSRLLWCRSYPRHDMAAPIDGLEDAFVSFAGRAVSTFVAIRHATGTFCAV